jgi:hypothetical protein
MKWRLLALFGVLGCASVSHDPLYDGTTVIYQATDSKEIQVTINNNRSRDLTDPRFYLIGMGRHDLGIVGSLSSKTQKMDRAWLGPDGCMSVVAHYVGTGDWVSDKVCWSPGEVIEVSLNPIFSTSTAWSHR